MRSVYRVVCLLLFSVGVFAVPVAGAQLIGSTFDVNVVFDGYSNNSSLTLPIFSGPVTAVNGTVVTQSFSQQLIQGGYGGPSNVVDGTITIGFSGNNILLTYNGQAQPFDISFSFTNIPAPGPGQGLINVTSSGTSNFGAPVLFPGNGVDYLLSPNFTANSITYLGFGLLGYQPGTSMTQTAALTFGPLPAVPESDPIVLSSLGLLVIAGAAKVRRRGRAFASAKSDSSHL